MKRMRVTTKKSRRRVKRTTVLSRWISLRTLARPLNPKARKIKALLR